MLLPQHFPRRRSARRVENSMCCKDMEQLKQLDSLGGTLNPEERTMFRALANRAMDVSPGRPDIMHSSKELCRGIAAPTWASVTNLKKLARYLVSKLNIIWTFIFGHAATRLDIFSDTDFGGCLRTRRSTSGGVARTCAHAVKLPKM